MAVKGTGQEFDVTLYAGDYVKTTTSQFKVVGAYATSTAADRTAYMADAGAALNNTYTARFAIGINQTYMSANSSECTVRMFGYSKAVCAASVPAFSFVKAYEGISTTTRCGQIETVADGASVSSYEQTIASQIVILGRALEDGSTGTVINVMLAPQMYDLNLVTEA